MKITRTPDEIMKDWQQKTLELGDIAYRLWHTSKLDKEKNIKFEEIYNLNIEMKAAQDLQAAASKEVPNDAAPKV